jgi:iron complex outermembrane receptor protein
VNAGGAEVKGAEFNAEAKITSRLTGRLGLTVLDATYTSFRNAPTTSINPNPPYGNFAYSPFNAAGKDLSHAPPVTFNVGADYVVPTSFGDWDVTLSYYYNDGYYWDPDNRIRQPSYGLLDGQVSWSLPGDNWRVAIWGKNLTGAEYYLYEAEEGTLDGYPAGPAAPRTYGITLSYDL